MERNGALKRREQRCEHVNKVEKSSLFTFTGMFTGIVHGENP